MQKIINLISVGDNLCVIFELKLSLKLNSRLRYHKSSVDHKLGLWKLKLGLSFELDLS